MTKLFFFVTCFFLCLCGLLTSCGLDTYPVLFAPYINGHQPDYNTDDYTSRYFSFQTNDSENSIATIKFNGTKVYYKIFNNSSKMISYQNEINTLNTNGKYSAAVEKMIDTQEYKELKTSKGNFSPLIKSSVQDRYVYIRLTDYQNSVAYSSGICLSVSNAITTFSTTDALQYKSEIVYPRRFVNSKYTFNFGGEDSNVDVIPIKDDADVCYSETFSESGVWYVDMYAVSSGIDTSTWINYYSPLIHLGSVSIKEGEDN